MAISKARSAGARRVQRHRARGQRTGSARVEVTVPAADAQLVKSLANKLRSGGGDATLIREALSPLLGSAHARTGADVLAFFRASPLVGIDLEIKRDQDTGRESPL